MNHFFAAFLSPLLLAGMVNPVIDLRDLENGEYYYERPAATNVVSNRIRNEYLLLSKRGRLITGIHLGSQAGALCFRGFIQENTIVDATRIFPPYTPASRWDFQEEMLDLAPYQQINREITANDREALTNCIQFFGER